jgi:drug/metabolite transporter (DMT)-like permease
MWLIFAIIGNFFMALVNYSDEYLTHSSTIKEFPNIHERIGGVLIMSVLLTIIGASVSFVLADTIIIDLWAILFAFFASIFVTLMAVGYFYVFQLYSAHQVVPLFGLASIWLLLIEFAMGQIPDAIAILGVTFLIINAYLLDNGSLKWKAPTTLLKYMIIVSLFWALTGIFWSEALTISEQRFAVYFWHLLGCFSLTLPLFLISPYRRGFIARLKSEKKRFIYHSLLNETCAQISFYFTMIAFSLASFASFVTAVSGINSLFLLALFYFFPINRRNSISNTQLYAILGMVLGIGLLEL